MLWIECKNYLPAAAQDSHDLTPSERSDGADHQESWAGNLQELTLRFYEALTSPLLSQQLPSAA
jgi:hypothetical protein